MINNKIQLSIVCASHRGKNKLPILINSIKENSYKAHEIIFCITDKLDTSLIFSEDIEKLNIKIILSNIKNQSYQRNLAIKSTTGNYILQLDDDVKLKYNTLKNYIKHFKKLETNKIVSAVVRLPDNNLQSFRWNKIYENNLFFRFVLIFLNNFKKIKPMSILQSGRIAPLIDFKNKKKISDAQWLNSCMMYNKSALKDCKSFDQKKQKSYFEDVYFSHTLYNKNYQLIIDSEIEVFHDFVDPTNFKTFINLISSQYYIVKNFKKNIILFYFDIFIFFHLYLLSTIIQYFRRRFYL